MTRMDPERHTHAQGNSQAFACGAEVGKLALDAPPTCPVCLAMSVQGMLDGGKPWTPPTDPVLAMMGAMAKAMRTMRIDRRRCVKRALVQSAAVLVAATCLCRLTLGVWDLAALYAVSAAVGLLGWILVRALSYGWRPPR